MKKTIGFMAVLAAVSFAVRAASMPFETLNSITSSADSVVFKLSGPGKFNAFKITNPLRLVIDFTGVEHNLKSKETPVGDHPVVSRIRSGQFQNEPIKIARAVIDLKKDTGYEIKSQGGEIILTFKPLAADTKSSSPKAAASTAPAGTPPAAVSAGASPAVPSAVAASTEPKPVEIIAVPIEEDTSVSKPPAPPTPAASTVDAPSTAPAPAAAVAPAKMPPPAAKPAVAPAGKSQPAASSKKSESPAPAVAKSASAAKPAVKKEEPKIGKTVLPKTLVSFDFQEADIRDVLRVLSAQSGINIIYGPDVLGPVTITLKNVPFDQAYNTVLTLRNLVSQEVGYNILRVMTPATLSQERTQAVTFTKLFPLNYAKADDVKAQLDAIRAAEGRRGIISVDERTNTLIITDTPEGLDSAARLIDEIDKKPYQVLIEAKLVEVTLTKDFDLGINWAYARTIPAGSDQVTVGKSNVEAADTQGVGVGGTIRTPLGPASGGAGVSLPASPVAGQFAGISFGIITDNSRLTAMLSTLSSKGLTKLLSNPRVTTLNNQEAKILVGQRVPYVQQTTQLGTAAGGVSSEVQWLEVGIKLTVKPTINADRQVTLKVLPQVSLLVRVDPAGPVIGTREAETTIMVKDNETVVIGGLIREEDKKIASQVPLLGDIPILGHLFKRNVDSKERSELLVFITPQILSD